MSTTEVVTSEHQTRLQTETWTHKEPLKLSGALKDIKSFDVTPIIGHEFQDVNLKEWLRAPNSDELLRDLAITSTSTNITT
jgi:hypothetical protein